MARPFSVKQIASFAILFPNHPYIAKRVPIIIVIWRVGSYPQAKRIRRGLYCETDCAAAFALGILLL